MSGSGKFATSRLRLANYITQLVNQFTSESVEFERTGLCTSMSWQEPSRSVTTHSTTCLSDSVRTCPLTHRAITTSKACLSCKRSRPARWSMKKLNHPSTRSSIQSPFGVGVVPVLISLLTVMFQPRRTIAKGGNKVHPRMKTWLVWTFSWNTR